MDIVRERVPVKKGVVLRAMIMSGSHCSFRSAHLAIVDAVTVVSVTSDHVVLSETVGTEADAGESAEFPAIINPLYFQVSLVFFRFLPLSSCYASV